MNARKKMIENIEKQNKDKINEKRRKAYKLKKHVIQVKTGISLIRLF